MKRLRQRSQSNTINSLWRTCWSDSNDADATVARTAAQLPRTSFSLTQHWSRTSTGYNLCIFQRFVVTLRSFAVRQNSTKVYSSACISRLNFWSYAISSTIIWAACAPKNKDHEELRLIVWTTPRNPTKVESSFSE